MASGTVTWKRDVPFKAVPWELRTSSSQLLKGIGVGKGASALGVRGPMQSVTSFRTGLEGTDQEEIPSGKSWAATFRSYRNEYNQAERLIRGDHGHPFDSVKESISVTAPRWHFKGSGVRYYLGPLLPDSRYFKVRGEWYPTTPPIPDLNWYGTAAVERTRPTRSAANLAVLLGELKRDGIPGIPGRLLSKPGDETLNWEFAVRPLLQDLQKLVIAIKNAKALLKQYERDAGRRVRRRYNFPTVQEELVVRSNGVTCQIANLANSSTFATFFPSGGMVGKLYETETTLTSIWFSGAWRYYISKNKGFWDAVDRLEAKLNYLLGVRITLSVLWELTPWSWFVDWNSNLGAVIHNLSSLSGDEQVLEYGYLMCTVKRTRVFSVSGVANTPEFGVSTSSEVQHRIRANPYGFSLSPSGYSPKQWAILVALGLAHNQQVGW